MWVMVITPEGEGIKAKILFVLIVPWKLLFAIGPPAGLCGGWPCFCYALAAIGFQVLLISDFGSQMGCQLYIRDTVTAITFVALGTSLPDLFASKGSALGDKYADNSVGNVTGSNAVNVFCGLGIPWMGASIYWAAKPMSASMWQSKGYGDLTTKYGYTNGYVVRSGDLGFSVIIFILCAIVTLSLILVRRRMDPPQELGGNKKIAKIHGGIMISLWFVYVLISCLSTYGYIKAFKQ